MTHFNPNANSALCSPQMEGKISPDAELALTEKLLKAWDTHDGFRYSGEQAVPHTARQKDGTPLVTYEARRQSAWVECRQLEDEFKDAYGAAALDRLRRGR